MLIGQGITKSSNGTEILRSIDLTVEPGKITVLIGPNGGGKSTLLRALSLLDPPSTGSVEVDKSLYTFPLVQNHKITPPWPRVTMVFQQLFLWPHLTLRQNIRLPLKNTDRSDTESRVEELIKLFRMSDFVDRYPNEASLGQRQRAALARALALEPSYLLLDEITSALDVEQIGIILSHLQMLRERGVGILIVTHLLGFARNAADKIVFLDEGKILQSGGSEVLDAPFNERIKLFLSMYKSGSFNGNQLDFVADAVMAQIRDGRFPEGENAEFLNRFQLVDLLRKRVEDRDLPELFAVIDREDRASAAFAVSLLRRFSHREDVQDRLRSRWDSADALLRGYLLWRILDDPALPGEWHIKLSDFVFTEWNTFRQEQLTFWGMPNNVLSRIKKRIDDRSYPASKKWAYLCCLPELAEDQDAAQELLRSSLNSKEPFTREISRKLLDRFF